MQEENSIRCLEIKKKNFNIVFIRIYCILRISFRCKTETSIEEVKTERWKELVHLTADHPVPEDFSTSKLDFELGFFYHYG